jgi:hypothetical protein
VPRQNSIAPAAGDGDEVPLFRIEEAEEEVRRGLTLGEIADHLQADHPSHILPLERPGVDGAPHPGGPEPGGLLVGVGDQLDPEGESAAVEEAGELEEAGGAAGVVVRPRIGPEIAERVIVGADDQQRTGLGAEHGDDVPVGPTPDPEDLIPNPGAGLRKILSDIGCRPVEALWMIAVPRRSLDRQELDVPPQAIRIGGRSTGRRKRPERRLRNCRRR